MSMMLKKLITGLTAFCWLIAAAEDSFCAETPPIDMNEMLDESTLAVEVLEPWHAVGGICPTRQKLVTIRVGELWPGQDYRIPVRMIVPPDGKARGFHLTGSHNMNGIKRDSQPRGIDTELIRGGVGLVYTIVQEPRTFGQGELADEMKRRFLKTLNPRYSVQYWGWPATIMRAATAAYAEKEHFKKGKVAVSGGSKNGASPSVAIIYDKRLTAIHATVSPIWDSPLRLCDREAWKKLDAYNKAHPARATGRRGRRPQPTRRHAFLGGTFGPIYTYQALSAGRSWAEIRDLAIRLADHTFISRNLEQLRSRGVDMLFHPGTHDFVAFDMAWGGKRFPSVPIYLAANTGHGKRGHKTNFREQNKSALLLQHFFEVEGSIPAPPAVSYRLDGMTLHVTVEFEHDSDAENGRIWWMYDRPPDGSNGYLTVMFPDDTWKDMKRSKAQSTWTASIDLEEDRSHIDFFSSHNKTLRYESRDYPACISCPYTRVDLKGARQEPRLDGQPD